MMSLPWCKERTFTGLTSATSVNSTNYLHTLLCNQLQLPWAAQLLLQLSSSDLYSTASYLVSECLLLLEGHPV